MRAPVAFALQGRAAKRRHHARADVVAERYGAKEAHAIDAELLAGRQSCGNHCGARVRARGAVRVVGFVRVGEHAVGESGLESRRTCWFEHTTVATFSPP